MRAIKNFKETLLSEAKNQKRVAYLEGPKWFYSIRNIVKYAGFPIGLVTGLLLSGLMPSHSTDGPQTQGNNVSEFHSEYSPTLVNDNKLKSTTVQPAGPTNEVDILGDIMVNGSRFNPVSSVLAKFNNTVVDPATFGLVAGFGKSLGLNEEEEAAVNKEIKSIIQSLVKLEKENVTVSTDQSGAQSFEIKPHDTQALKEEFRENLRRDLQFAQADLLVGLVTEDVIFGLSGRSVMNITADHVQGAMSEGAELEPVFVQYQYRNNEGLTESISRVMTRKAYFERYGPLASKSTK